MLRHLPIVLVSFAWLSACEGAPRSACRAVAESAFRALQASSPLNFPPDDQPPEVDFSFKLPDWVD
jgi:hypothetical protein